MFVLFSDNGRISARTERQVLSRFSEGDAGEPGDDRAALLQRLEEYGLDSSRLQAAPTEVLNYLEQVFSDVAAMYGAGAS